MKTALAWLVLPFAIAWLLLQIAFGLLVMAGQLIFELPCLVLGKHRPDKFHICTKCGQDVTPRKARAL